MSVCTAFGLDILNQTHAVKFAVCGVFERVCLTVTHLSLSVFLSVSLYLSPGEEQEAECVVLVLPGALR